MTDFDKDTWRQNSLCGGDYFGNGGLAEDFLDFDLEGLKNVFGSGVKFFVNPPYSNVTPFIQQAKRLRDAGHTVVMLLNNDKSTQWYQNHIHNVANEVIDIIGGRIAFVHPITGEEIKGNSKGQMVVVFDTVEIVSEPRTVRNRN